MKRPISSHSDVLMCVCVRTGSAVRACVRACVLSVCLCFCSFCSQVSLGCGVDEVIM